jgi:hypothetical protein
MPIHDWSRVDAGIFHHFHGAWMTELGNALNDGVLPSDYYALTDQIIGDVKPDVLTLRTPQSMNEDSASEGGVAVAAAPPKVRYTAEAEMDEYALAQRELVIRHASGDRIVALLEIVSPGNKNNRHALRRFVEKAAACLHRGCHLLILDLHGPGSRDPQGIHGAIWSEIEDDSYRAPADKPLTLAAYSAGRPKRAYVNPVAVGDALPPMPLFLTPERYVSVPLEATYQAAYRGVPQRWRRELENGSVT